VAALEAHDHVGAAREPVHDLPLAFVAPLGADDRHISHGFVLFVAEATLLRGEGRRVQPSRDLLKRRNRKQPSRVLRFRYTGARKAATKGE
jgi:hypothetical protein